MKEERTVRVSLNNLPENTQTDWEQVKNMTEADIDAAAASDPDAQPTDEAFWKDARIVIPQPKRAISMRVDGDVLAWFKSQGRGYQTRINAVLRAYMEAHRYEDKSATNATVIAETSNQPEAGKEA
ncbi:MAG: BrnA antitoxin family protein [Candidatus Poribacteria bacterium]|nr:BrnA antitoxin family protein [Candidatus Poribacteria bacterium]